jgi:hypothetical protein
MPNQQQRRGGVLQPTALRAADLHAQRTSNNDAMRCDTTMRCDAM